MNPNNSISWPLRVADVVLFAIAFVGLTFPNSSLHLNTWQCLPRINMNRILHVKAPFDSRLVGEHMILLVFTGASGFLALDHTFFHFVMLTEY